jgi:hypothetical protein
MSDMSAALRNHQLRDLAPERGTRRGIVLRTRMTVDAPRAAVFAAVTQDVAGWGRWFPGFSTDGRWTTAGPHGVGSTRLVTVFGRRFEETVVCLEDNRRWAFVVDRTDGPVLRSLREDYTFADNDRGGTTLTWVGAMDTGRLNVVLGPLLRVQLPPFFRYVARRLTRHLHR